MACALKMCLTIFRHIFPNILEVVPDSPESDYWSGRFQYRASEFFIDNLLVRIHSIIGMIWWTGLAPLEFEFPFPDSITSTILEHESTNVVGFTSFILARMK